MSTYPPPSAPILFAGATASPQATLHGGRSLKDHADDVLNMYSARVAADRIDGLFYMSVGSGRLRLANEQARRAMKFLQIGQPGRGRQPAGCHMEAILGEFGSGKSHLAYLLKHNLMNCGEEVLVAHCQITGESRFPAMMAAILRTLRVAGHESVQHSRIELSAYHALRQWIGGQGAGFFEGVMHRHLGNLPATVVSEFREAIDALAPPMSDGSRIQRFIDRWVARAEPKVALEVTIQILRLFAMVKVQRVALIVDEFESLSSLPREQQLETLQYLQDFHDDLAVRLADAPAVFLALFSTEKWWQTAGELLPSLFSPGDRTRQITPIPNVTKLDVFGLMDRYLTLYMTAETATPEVDADAFLAAAEAAWQQISASGKTHHMRSVHQAARAAVEKLIEEAGAPVR